MQNINNRGPSTEPCGTPQFCGKEADAVSFPAVTRKTGTQVRYLERAILFMPNKAFTVNRQASQAIMVQPRMSS